MKCCPTPIHFSQMADISCSAEQAHLTPCAFRSKLLHKPSSDSVSLPPASLLLTLLTPLTSRRNLVSSSTMSASDPGDPESLHGSQQNGAHSRVGSGATTPCLVECNLGLQQYGEEHSKNWEGFMQSTGPHYPNLRVLDLTLQHSTIDPLGMETVLLKCAPGFFALY